jgi:hypothetical protein
MGEHGMKHMSLNGIKRHNETQQCGVYSVNTTFNSLSKKTLTIYNATLLS